MNNDLDKILNGIVNNSTQKTYERTYKKIRDDLNMDEGDSLANEPVSSLIDYIKGMDKPNVAWMHYTIINKLLEDKTPAWKKLADKIKKDKEKNIKSKNVDLLENLPELKSIKKLFNNINVQTDPLKYIVNYLILKFNVRNEDIIKTKVTFNRKDAKDKNYNYIIINGNRMEYIRNVYKTSKTYGTKRNIISSSKFKNALENLREIRGGNDEFNLVVDKNGKMIDETIRFGSYIQPLTINQLGEGNIFKIVVKDINDHGSINQLKKVSNNRGTSIDTIISNYHLSRFI